MTYTLRRLWRWLTARPPTTCGHCGGELQQHPDGGPSGWCETCEGEPSGGDNG